MTREEIIKGLEDYIPWADEYEVNIEVLTGALELLKKEPCEDAISRQAAIKTIYDNKDRLNIAQAIRELPPVNPQPCGDLISRQEVIDGINVYFHDDYYQRTSIQDCRDCLIRDVIKALPPVTPQEPCNDAISRQAVLNEFYDVENLYERIKQLPSVNPQPCGDAISRQLVKEQMIKYGFHAPDMTVHEFVEDLLPVNPQKPKTGHWIRITNGALREKYICSECGRKIEDDGIESLLSIKYPYCHCGAKMVKPQERSDKE